MKKIINPWLGLEDEGYNCFGCSPSNPYGLKMEFYEDGEDIVSFWNPGNNYQGWLNTLHGGIQAALMDEIAMWVIARKLQTSGMTTNLNIKYRHPIPTGEGTVIEIRSHIREQKRNFVILDASIVHDGKVCSSAEITYYCFPKEKAASDYYFSGCHTEDEL
ncbi:MAG: PaaI family thioesterase [Bacteroidales bacterium]|nr:PaaI family thioesterase [Bacteroidales bacterium]